MKSPYTPLRFRDEDRVLLPVEELSLHARVSRAFIRLCIEQGCPTQNERLSQAMLLEWLFESYDFVRARAGLAPMAPVEGVDPEMLAKLKMGNSLLTLLEFSETRSTNEDEKRRIRNVYRMVSYALDRR